MINDIEHDALIAIDSYFGDLIKYLRTLSDKERLYAIEANELIKEASEHRNALYTIFLANKEAKDEEENNTSMNDYDDSMDGDHASALASAGWGTDEDYGYYADVD